MYIGTAIPENMYSLNMFQFGFSHSVQTIYWKNLNSYLLINIFRFCSIKALWVLLAFIESLLSLSFPFCHVKHARCVPLKHVPSAAYSAMCSTHLRLRAARQFYIVISLSLLFLYTSLHPCNCVLHNIYNLIFNNLHKHLTVPPLSSGPKVLS